MEMLSNLGLNLGYYLNERIKFTNKRLIKKSQKVIVHQPVLKICCNG